ncbi:SDR family NAD(P)-dependent oxidoreductase [Metabacillus iocasae]|uniref:Short-subunit dehydrogenase n=1 Tax=Priestia iocasae TaxID=2291674 RepID=A0ABS2R1E6_9BACI|nr:SDR family oxidoreductase [Metabacillus iocasae]MBM7705042.1 short-subunit dehydrogenase [Metabacillus iocasae]
MNQQVALITGASGGIGKELAYEFAKDGHHLVLVARSSDKLQLLKKELENEYSIRVMTSSRDLSVAASIEELYDELTEQNIQVDYVVNNAGFGLYGEFLTTNMDEELNMIDLNIRTLTHVTKKFLPDMVKRGRGGVLNVASTAAFQPGPLMAVYYATKAYVLSFTEALENELKGTGVHVTALCPGPTETGFSNRASLEQSKLFNSGVMDAKTVAEIGYKGFQSRSTIVIPGLQNKLLSQVVRFLPRKVITSIVRKVQARKS